MKLIHGTEQEHRDTLKRAKANGVEYIWSGDMRGNRYLAENFNFALENKIFEATEAKDSQETGWWIKWL
jgi:hypothetical protein